MNDAQHSFWGYFDTVAKLLAGIAFVCWMIQEWVIPNDGIFLLLAIFFGLADVFYLILHKVLQKNRLMIVFGWIVFAVLMVAIAKHPAKAKPAASPTIIAVSQPDYIEGTGFTTAQIKNLFPYGYIIFRLHDAKWTYDPEFPYEVKVTFGPDVKISPDFNTRIVAWTIPESAKVAKAPSINLVNNSFRFSVPMEVGKVYWQTTRNLGGKGMENQPQPLVATLSDNQLHPVFVLGFRIPSKEDIQP